MLKFDTRGSRSLPKFIIRKSEHLKKSTARIDKKKSGLADFVNYQTRWHIFSRKMLKLDICFLKIEFFKNSKLSFLLLSIYSNLLKVILGENS